MHVDVNGTRLWFDVEGLALVPDGPLMRERPTVILLHGGPGSFDHSYFKPDGSRLASIAQVVYLDLRGHGRSAWGDPARWTFEACADDVRAFVRQEPVPREEWALCWKLFGRCVITDEERARTVVHAALNAPGLKLMRDWDVRAQLHRIASPTLIVVGDLDPATPEAAAREVRDALPPGSGRLEVIERAGHFPWRDEPERFWPILEEFVRAWGPRARG